VETRSAEGFRLGGFAGHFNWHLLFDKCGEHWTKPLKPADGRQEAAIEREAEMIGPLAKGAMKLRGEDFAVTRAKFGGKQEFLGHRGGMSC
jgi:hypothetical protein